MHEESLQNTGPMSPSTETLQLSTGLPFRELIYCAVDSPAKTLVMPGSEQACEKAPEAGSGSNTSEPFARYDRSISWWRTSQVSLLTMHLDEYSETWPRAGMMRNGIVYQQVPLAPLTGEIVSGVLPTPTKSCARASGYPIKSQWKSWAIDGQQKRLVHLLSAYGMTAEQIAIVYEEIMGFPRQWTELGQ